MKFCYEVEDINGNCESFDYKVSWNEVLCALKEIKDWDDLYEHFSIENVEDEYELAELYYDDLKEYFEAEAMEWYKENE